MASEVLRTFFAIEIGDAARRVARDVAERLAAEPGGDAVRWTRPEAYHVTLRFLGRTPRDRVADVAGAVRRATAGTAPFAVQLGALHAFPTPKRPRVVVLELFPTEPIEALANAVEQAVVEVGFAAEARALHPHLTIGRQGRRPRSEPQASEVHRARETLRLDPSLGPADPAPFDVASIVLFQSVLGAGGSRYVPLERISF